MPRPFHPAQGRAVEYPTPARPVPWTARTDIRPEPTIDLRKIRTRRYEIMWLDESGNVEDAQRVAPALPAFEAAVSAMRQGTLLETPVGPRAVEDLLPGDTVLAANGRPDTVVWIGAMMAFVNPNSSASDTPLLTRVTADSFGLSRPSPDLVLGPGARLLHRSPACQEAYGTEGALAPIGAFVDGEMVVGLCPQSPVKVFHIAFARHRIIRANGVEIESFHPGNLAEMRISRDLLSYYLSLFPHVRSLEAFGGAAFPQLTLEDAQGLVHA